MDWVDGFGVEAFLLKKRLSGKWKARRLQTHVLVSAEAFVYPFQRETEAIGAMSRSWILYDSWLVNR